MIKTYKLYHTIHLDTATHIRSTSINEVDQTIRCYKNLKIYFLCSDDKLSRINYLGIRNGKIFISTVFDYRETMLACIPGKYYSSILDGYTLIMGEEYNEDRFISKALCFVPNDFLEEEEQLYKGYY